MQKLSRGDLLTLEAYSEARQQMRSDVIAHKRRRRVDLGEHISLLFEDRATIQYQIQEMLRVERIFDAAGIEEELDAYNPLIPDGSNWKATMMIQYEDVEERRRALAGLIGVERAVWVQVGEHARVQPVCDEDLERSTDEKTSSVHFLRFELDAQMVAAARDGAPISIGVEHRNYRASVAPLPANTAAALLGDLA